MEKYVSSLIISFFVYGFAGWIWESFICPLITGHKIKNSGFLNGPIVHWLFHCYSRHQKVIYLFL